MSRGNKLKTCVGYWGHLLLTGNQSSMIAELQDLSIERTNFSTGVNRQSFTEAGSAALVYTSREFQVKSLICFGHLELKFCVTVLVRAPWAQWTGASGWVMKPFFCTTSAQHKNTAGRTGKAAAIQFHLRRPSHFYLLPWIFGSADCPKDQSSCCDPL